MNKFKVGDRVKLLQFGKTGAVDCIEGDYCRVKIYNPGPYLYCSDHYMNIELIQTDELDRLIEDFNKGREAYRRILSNAEFMNKVQIRGDLSGYQIISSICN